MNPVAWQVLTWAFGALLTITLFALQRLLGKLDAALAENKVLTATVFDLKLANSELRGVSAALDRTLGAAAAAAVAVRQEGGSP
jgi:hypothetical protein